MEFKGATLLYTLAGLMITFAGFSALLLALRPAAGARLSLLDRYLAKTVMTYIFVLTAGALLPALFALYDIQEKLIWRGSAVLFALPMLFLQVTYPLRRRKRGRRRTAARNIRGLRCIRLRCDTGDAWLHFRRPPIQRRSLHHGVDDRLLYGRFRLRDRARCHYATTNGSVGAAGVALARVLALLLSYGRHRKMVSAVNEQLLDERLAALEEARAWSPRLMNARVENVIKGQIGEGLSPIAATGSAQGRTVLSRASFETARREMLNWWQSLRMCERPMRDLTEVCCF
jgi:hypothetical protein